MGIIVISIVPILYPQFSSRPFSLLSIFTLFFWTSACPHSSPLLGAKPWGDHSVLPRICSSLSCKQWEQGRLDWPYYGAIDGAGWDFHPALTLRTRAWRGLEWGQHLLQWYLPRSWKALFKLLWNPVQQIYNIRLLWTGLQDGRVHHTVIKYVFSFIQPLTDD